MLFDMFGQAKRLEDFLDPGFMRNVGAANRPAQSLRVFGGQSIDVEACRTGQFVYLTDSVAGIFEDYGNGTGDVAGGDRRSSRLSERKDQQVVLPQRWGGEPREER